MAKPDYLQVPPSSYSPVELHYQHFQQLSNADLLIPATYYNAWIEQGEVTPENTYMMLIGYVVSQYETYRRLAQKTAEPALKELLGEVMLHYWGIFQPTRQEVIAVLADFCQTQLTQARLDNNRQAWGRWSLIKATLINLPE